MNHEWIWIMKSDCLFHPGHEAQILIRKREDKPSFIYGCPDDSFPIYMDSSLSKIEEKIVKHALVNFHKWKRQRSDDERREELKQKQELRQAISEQMREKYRTFWNYLRSQWEEKQ